MEAARERSRGDGGARAAFLLAWSLAGLSVAMFVASVPLLVLARSAQIPSSWEANLTVGDLLGGVIFLIFPLVGAMIASRGPRNAIGWILLAEGLLWMFLGMTDYYGLYGVARPGSVPFPVGVAAVNNFMWVACGPAVGRGPEKRGRGSRHPRGPLASTSSPRYAGRVHDRSAPYCS